MNVLVIALITAAVFASGFGVGHSVNGWRLGMEIERQKGEIGKLEANAAILKAANDKCGIDVAEVRKAVKAVVDASAAQIERARAAMERAAKTSAGHLGRAEAILNQPAVPLAEQCAAIMREQRAYIDERRAR